MARTLYLWMVLPGLWVVGGGAAQPDPLLPWVDQIAAAVSASGCRSIGTAEFTGEVGTLGRYLPSRLEAGLSDAAAGRWQVVHGLSVTTALLRAGLQPEQLADPELVRAACAELRLDGLLVGRVERDTEALRIEAQLVRLPDGPVIALPPAELLLDGDLLALGGVGYAVEEQRGVRPKRLEAVRLALDSQGLPAAMDPNCPFRLEVLVDGQRCSPEQRGREVVVRLTRGSSYTLRLTNRSTERMGVALFVDGLNTIGQMRELPSAGLKWIVDPGRGVEVKGWQLGNAVRREFTLVEAAESVAGQRGLTLQLGLITASFYAAAERSAASPTTGLEEQRELRLGTGQGGAARSNVAEVEFAAALTPAAMLALRYELSEPETAVP